MVTLLAPAKINLTLEILGRRDDGYHTLRSLMVPIGLYDRIEAEPAPEASFAVEGSPAPPGDDNLVLRALVAAEVRERLAIRLRKAIPAGGGLGGGSSDAAAVLRAAMEGVLPGGGEPDWLAAARALGSDVPFFLTGTAALVEGTGERVTPLGGLPAWWCVAVRPPVAVATAEAYRRLDAARARTPAPSRPRGTSASLRAVDALQRGAFGQLLEALENDFHDLVIASEPAVARADAALRAAGGRSLLSGSGSCLFALFENESEARACASALDRGAVEDVFTVPLHHDGGWRPAS